jgi:DNA-binding CsgD family transcriptional regulator
VRKHISEHERRVLVAEALEQLTPRQRECVRLAVVDQLREDGLANALGISEKAAQNNIERACWRLSRYLRRAILPADLWGAAPVRGSVADSRAGNIVGGQCVALDLQARQQKTTHPSESSAKPQRISNRPTPGQGVE